MAENELCFVWGPPLSGQWRWMAHSAEKTPGEVDTALLPLLPSEEPFSLRQLLDRVDTVKESHLPLHVYLELPWSSLYEDIEIEEWAAANAEEWNFSFAAIVPADSNRLPADYRTGLEEFARASQSGVIICRPAGVAMPKWLENGSPDFGKRIDLFEEELWPAPEQGLVELPQLENRDLQMLTLNLTPERAQQLMERLRERPQVWGAEAYWKNANGLAEFLTWTQGGLFSWRSEEEGLKKLCTADGQATLRISATDLSGLLDN